MSQLPSAIERNAGLTPPMRPTSLERVSSMLMSLVGGLSLVAICLFAAWFAMQLPARSRVTPVDIIEISGGIEDGAVGETLHVESPADAAENPTLAEIPSDVTEVREALEAVVDSSEQAVELADKQFETGVQNTGQAGSRQGTGRRGRGKGPGDGGYPREERWYVRYAEGQTYEEYARQLDYFGIELGAIVGGRLAYIKNLSGGKPTVRWSDSGEDEKRLYMTWQGGGRKSSDLQAFRSAGLDVGAAPIFQFYTKEAENTLAALELKYRNRKPSEIRRTYFSVRAIPGGYEFHVTRQVLLK
jgi:hypothetical protein